MAKTSDIRNIVLLGHAGSGKTSITEAMLHTSGATNRLGSVDDGSTVSDFDDEEKSRQHSIYSSVLNAEHNGRLINILDTPGYPDFTGAALQCIAGAEAALIVINAAAGIEVNTRKMFRAAANNNKAKMIVINKIDSDNIDLPALLAAVQETFGSECRCANLPSADKSSVIDCISNDQGDSPLMSVADAHTEILENIIEADDELMEAYLGGEEVSKEKVAEVFVKAMVSGNVIPVVFTDAKNQVGIKELLDLVVDCVPSPDNAPAPVLVEGENETPVKVDPNGPLAGFVFRVAFDPKSNMKYSTIKVVSGKLSSSSQVIPNDEKKAIRVPTPMRLQGGEHTDIDAGVAGDIVTLAKVEELHVGDLIHEGDFKGKFKMPVFPRPMFSLALEPASRGDESKISGALDKLCDEDMCFTTSHDPQTKELVISGLGDIHLRVMLNKMETRYKVSVVTKPPKIPYKETITGKAEGHYRHKKQSGGAGQFGEVYLKVEPAERDSEPPMQHSWDIFGGSIPSQYEPAIVKGINDVMDTGVVAGYPMQDVKVSIYDGKYHPVDSKEVAFRAAGKGAFIDAIKKAKPALLEPFVDMEITIPADYMGDITGDLSSRRGRVSGQDMLPGNMVVIKAQVPLSEVMQYNSQLKSVTGGQGSYSMELSHYEPVPPNVQQQIVAQHAKEQEEE